ncbi:MAG: RtcB family protein [Candidatus Omnitrophota bacterium]
MSDIWQGKLEKIDDYRWRIPKTYKLGMRVPGIIYTTERMLSDIVRDRALEQVANVAFLPGIVKYSLAMPDIHWGYGFSIGGVAATDIKEGGVISPGGVGYDINCGVRLIRTNLTESDVKSRLKELVTALFNDIPAGVGSRGDIKISFSEEKQLLLKGSRWAVGKGYGVEEDLEHTESKGAIEGADPDAVSDRAYERGKGQAGTLGSGNHFLEIQVIDQVFDTEAASVFGVTKGQITIMIHSGSRGLGYQICDDYLANMIKCLSKYKINVPDRQLACAPVNSPEGEAYLSAMRCAANYAWVNRQCLMYLTRKTFERVFSKKWQELGMSLVYDVAHNIAKIETHEVDGKDIKVCVHRKGATRAFGPKHPELPVAYKNIGQPVIIPGDMGRHSYLLVGTEGAMNNTFASTCHGAGRCLSRTAAIKACQGRSIDKELLEKGIYVMARGRGTLAEEAPEAYKDVNEVVEVVHNAGISKRVCRMKPLGVIKG